MSIPDTCDVEVLVPLLEVVALDVLEVLELDVPEVLEVVEDVDVWTKRISFARHMTCLLSIVEPGYSECLGTLGETIKTCIHDFEIAWKIFLLYESIEKNAQLHMLQETVMKSCNRYQHDWNCLNMFVPTHLSWLVMSYAALTFSIDPRIHRKDSDTFFQVCPPGVRFRVSINIIYIQIMFVSHYQEVQTAFVCNEPAGYLASVRIKTHTQTIPSLNSELLLKWKEIILCFRETFRRASAMQASASAMQASASAFCFHRRFWDHFASATAAKYIPATMANIPATQTEHGS